MDRDAEDILKEIRADIEGVSFNDIQFKDLRVKKKRVKKKEKKLENKKNVAIIDNQEGFSISETETEFCSYKDISGKGKLRSKNSLEEWGAYDFFRFAHCLYLKKYKVNWDLNIGGNSIEINRIRDKFYDIFGFCCNLIMRDYIVFFFDSYIDDFRREEGDFYFNQMRKDHIILAFREDYDFQERFTEYMTKEKNKNKKYSLTKEEIKISFSIGDATLLVNYGVVIALNWLLKIKKMSKKEAVKLVVDICRDMYEKDILDIIKNSTEVYSPYPSNLLFKSPQLIFNKIDKNMHLNVVFTGNKKILFLQKGDN